MPGDLSAELDGFYLLLCVSMSFETQRSESEFRLNVVFVVVSGKITGTRVSSFAPRHAGLWEGVHLSGGDSPE